MRFVAIVFAALLCAVPAFAQEKPITVDGDSVKLRGEDMRIVDMDAPETLEPNCPQEQALGYQASGRLQRLINRRAVRIERLAGPDKYKRTLIRLYVGKELASKVLISEGLAVAYNGKTRRVHWARTLCGLAEPKTRSFGYLRD